MKIRNPEKAFWPLTVSASLLLGFAAFALYAYFPASLSHHFRLVHTIGVAFLVGFIVGNPQRGAIAAALSSVCISTGLILGMHYPAFEQITYISSIVITCISFFDGIFGWQGAKCRPIVANWLRKNRAGHSA